jgi:hypothetical protein
MAPAGQAIRARIARTSRYSPHDPTLSRTIADLLLLDPHIERNSRIFDEW